MTNPTPLQLMDRLLDALKEAGDGARCREDIVMKIGERGMPIATVAHLLDWGNEEEMLTAGESWSLHFALDAICDDHGFVGGCLEATAAGWDFARFREELAKREGEGD